MFTIKQPIIDNVISTAVQFTDTKDINASCIFISGMNAKLVIEATNYQESIMMKDIPAVDLKANFERFAINGKKLQTIVKSFGDVDLLFKIDGNNLIVKNGRSRFKIPIMEENDLSISYPKGSTKLNLSREILNGMETISHAIDKNTTNFVMSGCLLEVKTNAIALIGTDGKRLAGVKYKHESDKEMQIVIPRGSMGSMSKIFNGDVDCYLDDVHMTIEAPNITYTTKLINGKYPDWKRIFPKSIEKQVSINRDDLLSLAKQALVISNETTVTIDNGELTFTSKDENGESMQAGVDFDASVSGIVFSVNLKYLVDCLNSCSQDITLLFNDTNTPFVIKDEVLSEVIMPIANFDARSNSNSAEKEAA